MKTYSCQEDENFKPLENAITPVEGLVLDLALSLYHAGNETFTALDLLATGKKRVDRSNTSYSQIQEIEAAVYALRDVWVSVSPKYEDPGQLLPVFTSGKAALAENKSLIIWRFKSEPVLLTVSREIFKGVLEYPSELLAIGDTRGLEGLALKKYLLDRVYYCSAQKGRYASRRGARTVLFQNVYKHMYGAGKKSDSEKRQRRRLKAKVIRLMDEYSKNEICPLSGYTVYKSRGLPNSSDIGFRLLFDKEEKDKAGEDAAQKAREGFKVSSKRGGETLEN